MNQQPSGEKPLINGTVGGLLHQPSGTIAGGGRGTPAAGAVTTVAPKVTATAAAVPPTRESLPPPPPPPAKEADDAAPAPQTPRKSKSMGRIHGSGEGGGGGGPQDAPNVKEEGGGVAPTAFRGHRRVPSDGVAWRHSKAMESEMEGEDKFLKRTYKSEYRKKFRPFSQYQYVDGKFHKSKTEGGNEVGNAWYKEVLELRRQAGQYRCRGWGVETASDRMAEIYNKQVELWEQVSRRSSLQALSLASAAPSRPVSKAEKELENSRRSSPIKHARDRPTTAPSKQKPITVHKATEKLDGKTQKDATPRHHYEKTTGAPGRSVSVGPENRSPKRSSRPPSSTHSGSQAPSAKAERRPRPTSLTTSSRRKGADSALPHHEAKKSAKKTHDISASPKRSSDLKTKDEKRQSSEEEPKKEKEAKDSSRESLKEAAGRKATPEPRFDPEKYEPVVKTPPEPTRVKSPDQVMVKSPDPVNWTVPLDTGKTFTVTHNIPEGEASRGTPSSEHRPSLEPRSRQTPEPTKVYQGSLAGTPITTAGTGAAVASATPATSTTASSSSQPPSKTDPASTTKTSATAASSTPSSAVSTLESSKEPVSGVVSASSDIPNSEKEVLDKKGGQEAEPEPSSAISTATKPVDSKPLTSIKETSPQPLESSMPNTSEVVETKSSPASPTSTIGLSSGTLDLHDSIYSFDSNSVASESHTVVKNDTSIAEHDWEDVGGHTQPLGKCLTVGNNEHLLDSDINSDFENKNILSDENKSSYDEHSLQISNLTLEQNISDNNTFSLSKDISSEQSYENMGTLEGVSEQGNINNSDIIADENSSEFEAKNDHNSQFLAKNANDILMSDSKVDSIDKKINSLQLASTNDDHNNFSITSQNLENFEIGNQVSTTLSEVLFTEAGSSPKEITNIDSTIDEIPKSVHTTSEFYDTGHFAEENSSFETEKNESMDRDSFQTYTYDVEHTVEAIDEQGYDSDISKPQMEIKSVIASGSATEPQVEREVVQTSTESVKENDPSGILNVKDDHLTFLLNKLDDQIEAEDNNTELEFQEYKNENNEIDHEIGDGDIDINLEFKEYKHDDNIERNLNLDSNVSKDIIQEKDIQVFSEKSQKPESFQEVEYDNNMEGMNLSFNEESTGSSYQLDSKDDCQIDEKNVLSNESENKFSKAVFQNSSESDEVEANDLIDQQALLETNSPLSNSLDQSKASNPFELESSHEPIDNKNSEDEENILDEFPTNDQSENETSTVDPGFATENVSEFESQNNPFLDQAFDGNTNVTVGSMYVENVSEKENYTGDLELSDNSGNFVSPLRRESVDVPSTTDEEIRSISTLYSVEKPSFSENENPSTAESEWIKGGTLDGNAATQAVPSLNFGYVEYPESKPDFDVDSESSIQSQFLEKLNTSSYEEETQQQETIDETKPSHPSKNFEPSSSTSVSKFESQQFLEKSVNGEDQISTANEWLEKDVMTVNNTPNLLVSNPPENLAFSFHEPSNELESESSFDSQLSRKDTPTFNEEELQHQEIIDEKLSYQTSEILEVSENQPTNEFESEHFLEKPAPEEEENISTENECQMPNKEPYNENITPISMVSDPQKNLEFGSKSSLNSQLSEQISFNQVLSKNSDRFEFPREVSMENNIVTEVNSSSSYDNIEYAGNNSSYESSNLIPTASDIPEDLEYPMNKPSNEFGFESSLNSQLSEKITLSQVFPQNTEPSELLGKDNEGDNNITESFSSSSYEDMEYNLNKPSHESTNPFTMTTDIPENLEPTLKEPSNEFGSVSSLNSQLSEKITSSLDISQKNTKFELSGIDNVEDNSIAAEFSSNIHENIEYNLNAPSHENNAPNTMVSNSTENLESSSNEPSNKFGSESSLNSQSSVKVLSSQDLPQNTENFEFLGKANVEDKLETEVFSSSSHDNMEYTVNTVSGLSENLEFSLNKPKNEFGSESSLNSHTLEKFPSDLVPSQNDENFELFGKGNEEIDNITETFSSGSYEDMEYNVNKPSHETSSSVTTVSDLPENLKFSLNKPSNDFESKSSLNSQLSEENNSSQDLPKNAEIFDQSGKTKVADNNVTEANSSSSYENMEYDVDNPSHDLAENLQSFVNEPLKNFGSDSSLNSKLSEKNLSSQDLSQNTENFEPLVKENMKDNKIPATFSLHSQEKMKFDVNEPSQENFTEHLSKNISSDEEKSEPGQHDWLEGSNIEPSNNVEAMFSNLECSKNKSSTDFESEHSFNFNEESYNEEESSYDNDSHEKDMTVEGSTIETVPNNSSQNVEYTSNKPLSETEREQSFDTKFSKEYTSDEEDILSADNDDLDEFNRDKNKPGNSSENFELNGNKDFSKFETEHSSFSKSHKHHSSDEQNPFANKYNYSDKHTEEDYNADERISDHSSENMEVPFFKRFQESESKSKFNYESSPVKSEEIIEDTRDAMSEGVNETMSSYSFDKISFSENKPYGHSGSEHLISSQWNMKHISNEDIQDTDGHERDTAFTMFSQHSGNIDSHLSKTSFDFKSQGSFDSEFTEKHHPDEEGISKCNTHDLSAEVMSDENSISKTMSLYSSEKEDFFANKFSTELDSKDLLDSESTQEHVAYETGSPVATKQEWYGKDRGEGDETSENVEFYANMTSSNKNKPENLSNSKWSDDPSFNDEEHGSRTFISHQTEGETHDPKDMLSGAVGYTTSSSDLRDTKQRTTEEETLPDNKEELGFAEGRSSTSGYELQNHLSSSSSSDIPSEVDVTEKAQSCLFVPESDSPRKPQVSSSEFNGEIGGYEGYPLQSGAEPRNSDDESTNDSLTDNISNDEVYCYNQTTSYFLEEPTKKSHEGIDSEMQSDAQWSDHFGTNKQEMNISHHSGSETFRNYENDVQMMKYDDASELPTEEVRNYERYFPST